MTLAIRARFLSGRYDAAVNRELPEWPPHPGRLYAAMTSVAQNAADDECLTWLEGFDPPVVVADCEPLGVHRRSGYVVLNAVPTDVGEAKNAFHPGRPTGAWSRVSVALPREEVWFVWPDVQPTAARLIALRSLLRRVPYLGRSSCPVLLDCADAGPGEAASGTWTAAEATQTAAVDVRVPYPGFLAELRRRHDAGDRAWEAARSVRYVHSSTVTRDEPPAAAAGWSDLIVLGFAAGVRVDGAVLPRITTALRAAVMRRTQEQLGDAPLPAAVHGHRDDSEPTRPGQIQVGFLALPFVGHEHADGHLLGVAVVLPPRSALDGPPRRAVLRALLTAAGKARDLPVPGAGRLALDYDPARSTPAGLLPERWTGPSVRWMSATPLVLDVHPKRGNWERAVRRTVANSALPDPVVVEVSNEPLQPGVPRIDARAMPERDRRYPPMVHAALTFDRPVSGPVLAGRLRYLGLGLFSPAPAPSGAA